MQLVTLWCAPSHLSFDIEERAHFIIFLIIYDNILNNNMINVFDHDHLVLFTSLPFPFGDGQVVCDVSHQRTIDVCTHRLLFYLPLSMR
jgi:hypothetical protein